MLCVGGSGRSSLGWATAQGLFSWSVSLTLASRPSSMRCIKLGGLEQQVMQLICCLVCSQYYFGAHYLSYYYSCFDCDLIIAWQCREGEAQACHCQQPSRWNQRYKWLQGNFIDLMHRDVQSNEWKEFSVFWEHVVGLYLTSRKWISWIIWNTLLFNSRAQCKHKLLLFTLTNSLKISL